MNFKKVVFVIAFLGIFAGGFFAWQYLGVSKEEVKTPGEITKDETANWKTYRNDRYGFEIKYPQDWFVREDTFTKEIYFREKGEVIGAEGEKIPEEKIGFSVGFYSNISKLWGNENNLSLENWISKNFLPLQEGEIRETIAFGANNYKGILLKKYKGVGVISLITTVYVERNSSVYELKGEVPTPATVDFPTEYDYDKVFNQMLSTFRFIGLIQVGKIKIDYEYFTKTQGEPPAEGHQPWQVDPQLVARAKSLSYGFDYEDFDKAKQIVFDAEKGIAKYEVPHGDKIYIITVIQPIPGENKIWTISEIQLKE